jgi:hypothetical protein
MTKSEFERELEQREEQRLDAIVMRSVSGSPREMATA